MSTGGERPWFFKYLQPGASAKDSLLTRRLLLRPLNRQDAKDFHAYARDPLVAKYVYWEPHKTLAQTRIILQGLMLQNRAEGLHTKALVLRDSLRMVGTIGLVWADKQNRVAELGFSLARDCWGQGLMAEALGAYLDYLFTTQGYERLEARHDILNPASGAVMRKAGMREEGLPPERVHYKGREASLVVYAARREDRQSTQHRETTKT